MPLADQARRRLGRPGIHPPGAHIAKVLATAARSLQVRSWRLSFGKVFQQAQGDQACRSAKKKLRLDRNLSRLLANLTFAGSLNFFCSAATLITHDMKRLCPCAV